MNKYCIRIMLIFLLLISGVPSSQSEELTLLSTSVNANLSPTYPHYVAKESLFEKFDHKNKIVFIGDSITDRCEWNELLGRNDIVNRGIDGDTTNGVLNRLDFYLLQEPKSIFLMIGINDIYLNNNSMDIVKTNYLNVIDKILSRNVQLFIQSTLNTSNMALNDKVAILNNYLVEQCKLKSIPYIDVNGQLSKDNLLSSKYTNDGTHLNGDGYFIWKQVLLPYINRLY